MNRDQQAEAAKRLCANMENYYYARYPEFDGRIDPILFHIALYQHLVNQISVPESHGRILQQELISSFEQWYPGIHHARRIDWIEMNIEVLEYIQGIAKDYGYGYEGEPFYTEATATRMAANINHQLFHMLPISTVAPADTNQNLEILRQLTDLLTDFWPDRNNETIPGERALFHLLVQDIYQLVVKARNQPNPGNHLDVYLYLFQCSVLDDSKSKQDCAKYATAILDRVNNIQMEGSLPQVIDYLWQMGCGYSDELVRDYNQIVELLDGHLCTVDRKDITEGFELRVWRYPDPKDTGQTVIIKGDGKYILVYANKESTFSDARSIDNQLKN